jgi:hypothetical protein
MANMTSNRKTSGQTPYPAERARQGEIILRKPWQRWVFFSGPAASVVLALLIGVSS